MKRCDIRAAFKDISQMLARVTINKDGIEQEASYYLLQAARIETCLKSKITQDSCGKAGNGCLRNASREAIVEKVAFLARDAIPRYIGELLEEELDAIAAKFGELAAGEQLKGWCQACDDVAEG